MELAVFVGKYPYFKEKEFIEDELPFFATHFDCTYIFTEGIGDKIFWPSINNCSIIQIRKKKYVLRFLFLSFFLLFGIGTYKEILFAKRKLKRGSLFEIIRNIFINYYFYFLYKASVSKMIKDKKNVVFLSYWMDHKAYALYRLKKNNIIFNACSRAHGFDCFIDRGYLSFRREILSNLDTVFCISETGKTDIIAKLGPFIGKTKMPNIKCIRLGTTKQFDSVNPLNDNTVFRIVSCSNIVKIKRIDLIIHSLSILHIPNKKIEWIHFGDGELSVEIKEEAKKMLDKNANVSYQFAGHVSNEEVQKFYSQHQVNLFINSSDNEGIPVSIMEACSYGIPIVARNVGGMCEIVDESNGFLLLNNSTSKDICCAIERIATLPQDKIIAMRSSSYKRWQEKFNSETNSNMLANELKISFSRTKSANGGK